MNKLMGTGDASVRESSRDAKDIGRIGVWIGGQGNSDLANRTLTEMNKQGLFSRDAYMRDLLANNAMFGGFGQLGSATWRPGEKQILGGFYTQLSWMGGEMGKRDAAHSQGRYTPGPAAAMLNQFNVGLMAANSYKNVEMAAATNGTSRGYMWEAQMLGFAKQGGGALAAAASASIPILGPIVGVAIKAATDSIKVNAQTGERTFKLDEKDKVALGVSLTMALVTLGVSSAADTAREVLETTQKAVATAETVEATKNAADFLTLANNTANNLSTIQKGVQLTEQILNTAVAGLQTDNRGRITGWKADDSFWLSTAGVFTGVATGQSSFSGAEKAILGSASNQTLNIANEYYKFSKGRANNYQALANPDLSSLGGLLSLAGNVYFADQQTREAEEHNRKFQEEMAKTLFEKAREEHEKGNKKKAAEILAGMGYAAEKRKKLLGIMDLRNKKLRVAEGATEIFEMLRNLKLITGRHDVEWESIRNKLLKLTSKDSMDFITMGEILDLAESEFNVNLSQVNWDTQEAGVRFQRDRHDGLVKDNRNYDNEAIGRIQEYIRASSTGNHSAKYTPAGEQLMLMNAGLSLLNLATLPIGQGKITGHNSPSPGLLTSTLNRLDSLGRSFNDSVDRFVFNTVDNIDTFIDDPLGLTGDGLDYAYEKTANYFSETVEGLAALSTEQGGKGAKRWMIGNIADSRLVRLLNPLTAITAFPGVNGLYEQGREQVLDYFNIASKDPNDADNIFDKAQTGLVNSYDIGSLFAGGAGILRAGGKALLKKLSAKLNESASFQVMKMLGRSARKILPEFKNTRFGGLVGRVRQKVFDGLARAGFNELARKGDDVLRSDLVEGVPNLDFVPSRNWGKISKRTKQYVLAFERAKDGMPIVSRGEINSEILRELQLATHREIALVRFQDGTRRLILGVSPEKINLPPNVKRIIAHTHPGYDDAFSVADLLTMALRNQKSSVLVPEHLPSRRLRIY